MTAQFKPEVKTIQDFKENLEIVLDEYFPKLNEKDVSKPSPNNRSAALVLFAQAVILARILLENNSEK